MEVKTTVVKRSSSVTSFENRYKGDSILVCVLGMEGVRTEIKGREIEKHSEEMALWVKCCQGPRLKTPALGGR